MSEIQNFVDNYTQQDTPESQIDGLEGLDLSQALEESKKELNLLKLNILVDGHLAKNEISYVREKYFDSRDELFSEIKSGKMKKLINKDFRALSQALIGKEGIREIQSYFFSDNKDIDGLFGPATFKKIIDFQNEQGLKVDGIAGNETLNRIKILKSKDNSEKRVNSIATEIQELFPRDDMKFISGIAGVGVEHGEKKKPIVETYKEAKEMGLFEKFMALFQDEDKTQDNSIVEKKESKEKENTQLFLSSVREFLGKDENGKPIVKYDSYRKGGVSYHGQASYRQDNNGNYTVSYKDGSKYETKNKPLVCIDLIVESLRKLGDFSSLDKEKSKDNGPFYLRRVNNMEKEFDKDPAFDVENINSTTSFKEGDIITTINQSSGARHIGVVSSVDKNNTPIQLIHCSYSFGGVVETSYNDFLKNRKYIATKKISLI